VGDNAALEIELTPSRAGPNLGLNITSGGSTVRGLAVHGFHIDIEISGGAGNTIAGCFLGTGIMGTTSDGSFGIYIGSGATSNVVGSSAGTSDDLSARNLISVAYLDPEATDNIIAGNDVNGSLLVDGSQNIIDGNDLDGMFSIGSPVELVGNDNTLAGNYIGTDATGTQLTYFGGARPVPGQLGAAVWMSGQGNTIGGTASGAGNVINQSGPYPVDLLGASSSTIEGNFIGTDPTGTRALSGGGIRIYESDDTTVEGNVIGGQSLGSFTQGVGGVQIWSGSDNVVESNAIGTDATGTINLGGANGLEEGVPFVVEM
jgi:hypothetical protein